MSRIFGGSKVLMAATKVKAKPSIVPSSTVSSKEKPVRRNTGLFKAVSVSPAMQKFLGVSEISRPDAVKRVWEHIKMNSLQNPADKKEIQCDEKLKIIFDGKDKVGFLEIAKLMSPHFIKAT